MGVLFAVVVFWRRGVEAKNNTVFHSTLVPKEYFKRGLMVTTPSRPCRPRRLPKPPTNCTFFFCFWVEQQRQVLITVPGGPDDDLELWNAHNSLLFTARRARSVLVSGWRLTLLCRGGKSSPNFPLVHKHTRTQQITPNDSN